MVPIRFLYLKARMSRVTTRYFCYPIDTLKIEIMNVHQLAPIVLNVLTRNILRVLLSRTYGDTKNRAASLHTRRYGGIVIQT